MLGYRFIAEEVFTVQAATELLQKAKHIVDTIHHGKAEKVLLSIKCSWNSRTFEHFKSQFRCTNSEKIFFDVSQIKRQNLKATEQTKSNT